mgnify:FL=1
MPDPQVTKEMGETMASQYRCKYIETSAKENINIDEMFEKILAESYEFKFIKNAKEEPKDAPKQQEPIKLGQTTAQPVKKDGGCKC